MRDVSGRIGKERPQRDLGLGGPPVWEFALDSPPLHRLDDFILVEFLLRGLHPDPGTGSQVFGVRDNRIAVCSCWYSWSDECAAAA